MLHPQLGTHGLPKPMTGSNVLFLGWYEIILSHIIERGNFSWICPLGGKIRRMGLKNPLSGSYPKSTRVDVIVWHVVIRGA
jgi:hypothetical protein